MAGVNVLERAEELYNHHINNDPIIHTNRFAFWKQLTDDEKGHWIMKALKELKK